MTETKENIKKRIDTNKNQHIENNEIDNFLKNNKSEELNNLGEHINNLPIYNNDELKKALNDFFRSPERNKYDQSIKNKVRNNQPLNKTELSLMYLAMISDPNTKLSNKDLKFDTSEPIDKICSGYLIYFIRTKYNNPLYTGKKVEIKLPNQAQKKKNTTSVNPMDRMNEAKKIGGSIDLPQNIGEIKENDADFYCDRLITRAENNFSNEISKAKRELERKHRYKNDNEKQAYIKYDTLLIAFEKYTEIVGKKHDTIIHQSGYENKEDFENQLKLIETFEKEMKQKYPNIEIILSKLKEYEKEMGNNEKKYFKNKNELKKAEQNSKEFNEYIDKKTKELDIDKTKKSLNKDPETPKEAEEYCKNLNKIFIFQEEISEKSKSYGDSITKYQKYVKGAINIQNKYNIQQYQNILDKYNQDISYWNKKINFKKYENYTSLLKNDGKLTDGLKNISTLNNLIVNSKSKSILVKEFKQIERLQQIKQEETDKFWDNIKKFNGSVYWTLTTLTGLWNGLIDATVGTFTSLMVFEAGLFHGKEDAFLIMDVKEKIDNYLKKDQSSTQKEDIYNSETKEFNFHADNTVTTVASSISQMLTLIYGGGALAKGATKAFGIGEKIAGKIGLFSSSFIMQVGGSYQEAITSGLTGGEALGYSMLSATVQSGIELLSPNEVLLGKGSGITKELIKNACRSGSKESLKMIGKTFTKNVGLEIAEENIQEALQLAAGNLINMTANGTFGSELGADRSWKNFTSTAIITTLTTGITTGTSTGLQMNNLSSQDKTKLIEHIKNDKGTYIEVTEMIDKATAGKVKIPNVDINQLKNLKLTLSQKIETTGGEIVVPSGKFAAPNEIANFDDENGKFEYNNGILILKENGEQIGNAILKIEENCIYISGLVSFKKGSGTQLIRKIVEISDILGKGGHVEADASPYFSVNGQKSYRNQFTNLGFYYKLGFRAKDPEIHKKIQEYINKGEEIPLGLNYNRSIYLTDEGIQNLKNKDNLGNNYFDRKSHKFEVTETQARGNSEMMDNLLNEIKKEGITEIEITKKLGKLRKTITKQYKQSTGEELNLTDEQLLSIIDAHEQDGELGKLTLGQLKQKVKILDETITDPKLRRFLLEAGFCGKIEIISDIQNNIPSLLNKYKKSSINFEFSKNNPELHESFIKTGIITKLTNYTDVTIEKGGNPELLEILKQAQEELENLPYEERLKTIININTYIESAKKAKSFINLVKRGGTTAKELFLRTRGENTNRITDFEGEITIRQFRNSIIFIFEKSNDVKEFFGGVRNGCHFASNIAGLDTIMINKENCKNAGKIGLGFEDAMNRTIFHESQHTINKFFMSKTTDIAYKEAIDPKKTDIETFKQYALDRAKDEIIAQYTNRLIIKNLSTETISILSKGGGIKELLTTEGNTYDYFKKRRNTPEEKKARKEHIEKVKNLIDCIDETFKTLSKSGFNSDTNIQNVLNLFSCTNITERKNIQNMVNNKFNINNYFDGKLQKIFKGDTKKAEANSKTSDRILSEINEQNESEKLEELRKEISEQYKQTTGEELNLTDEQLLSILDAHEKKGRLGELTLGQLKEKVKKLSETITDPNVRRFLLEAGFCGQERVDTKTNVEHLEELGIKIPEYSKERFNKMNLDFEVLKGLKELGIISSGIVEISQYEKFNITKLKHFQKLGVEINESNILYLNKSNLNDKEIIKFRELQKIGIEIYVPEILNETEFDYQKLSKLKELGININEYNIIELNNAEINFQILKRLENIGIKLIGEDIIGISSDKIEINIDKLEQLKEIGVDINEDNAIELNGTDYNFDKLRYLKEIGININEDNIAELNEAEINIDKLEQLKEIGIDINEDNVIELNGTDYNFDKLRYLKEIGININEKNITKLNKINNENILMLKKIGNEKVQVIIKHKGLDVTSKPEWFIKHINIFTVPDVMSRVAELNKMGIIISYDNHNLLIPKNFKKIKQFSELGIDVSKDSELCLNTEITQDIIKRLNTLKGFGISPVRLKAINRINNLENRGIETNDILSQEYTVNYKEYGIKEDEIKANLQYKKGEIIEKIQQYIQNAISKKENIGETEIINRIRTNLMVLPKIERLNLLTTISEVVEKSNNIRKYIDFENGPYKDKYPNAKTLLCAIRGITEPNIIDKITDDVTVIQHGTGLNFFVGDEKSYQIIKDKSLTNSKIESGGFNTTASKIKELEGTLSVINGKDPGKDTKQFEYNAVWHEGQHNRNSYFMPDKYGSRIAYSKDEILAYSRDGTSIKEIEETLTTPENKGGLYQYNLKGKERENHKKQVKELLGFANDLFELANNSKTGLTRDKVLSMLSDTPANERKNLHATITDALKIHIERSTNQTNFDQSKIRELKERFINKIKERAGNNKLINNLLDFWNSTFSEYKINPEEFWWAGTAKKETVVNEIESCNSIDEIRHALNNPKYSHIGRGPNNRGGFEISAIIDEVISGRVESDILPLEIRPKIEGFIKK